MAWERLISLKRGKKVLDIYVNEEGSRARLVSRLGDGRLVVEDWAVLRESPKLDDFLRKLGVGE